MNSANIETKSSTENGVPPIALLDTSDRFCLVRLRSVNIFRTEDFGDEKLSEIGRPKPLSISYLVARNVGAYRAAASDRVVGGLQRCSSSHKMAGALALRLRWYF